MVLIYKCILRSANQTLAECLESRLFFGRLFFYGKDRVTLKNAIFILENLKSFVVLYKKRELLYDFYNIIVRGEFRHESFDCR